MSLWLAILIGLGSMMVVMLLLWLRQRATRNAASVDIAWSFGTGVMGVFFAVVATGWDGRRWLVAALVALWAFRLGVYLWQRIAREEEDGRYQMMRDRWGSKTQSYLFAFFQIQATWAVLFALPMFVAASNPTSRFTWLDGVGIAIWVIAILGESVADAQLTRFRANPSNKGAVCRDGLWYYSRHPNYFFEWLHWWAYVAIALAGGWAWGWLTLGGPAVMLIFLLKVTGIPPTEAQAVRSRGEAYRQYQRTTSSLFPWPPRKNSKPQSHKGALT